MEKDIKQLMEEEQEIREILIKKIRGLESYDETGSMILSYGLAEILAATRRVHGEIFEEIRFLPDHGSQQIWDKIMELRMHLLNLKDCIQEFDENLLNLMQGGKEEEEEQEEEE